MRGWDVVVFDCEPQCLVFVEVGSDETSFAFWEIAEIRQTVVRHLGGGIGSLSLSRQYSGFSVRRFSSGHHHAPRQTGSTTTM